MLHILDLNKILNYNQFSVDCEWSDWRLGDCSATCGDGLRENHRYKVTEEKFGGKPCEGEAQTTEQCNERLCPGK